MHMCVLSGSASHGLLFSEMWIAYLLLLSYIFAPLVGSYTELWKTHLLEQEDSNITAKKKYIIIYMWRVIFSGESVIHPVNVQENREIEHVRILIWHNPLHLSCVMTSSEMFFFQEHASYVSFVLR